MKSEGVKGRAGPKHKQENFDCASTQRSNIYPSCFSSYKTVALHIPTKTKGLVPLFCFYIHPVISSSFLLLLFSQLLKQVKEILQLFV